MAARLSSLFPVLILLLLAALTYWLDKSVQGQTGVAEQRVTDSPDFTAEKLIATRMDVNGHIRDTLHAEKMVHFAADDSSELESPRFVSLARGAPLSVTAKQARVTSNAGNIYFRGNVRATRAAQAGKSALVLTTEYLHLLPDDHIAKTDQPVTISDNSMKIKAAGMELNNETRVLQLRGGVRGVYHDAAAISAGRG